MQVRPDTYGSGFYNFESFMEKKWNNQTWDDRINNNSSSNSTNNSSLNTTNNSNNTIN